MFNYTCGDNHLRFLNLFNTATFLCLCQDRTWISNVICCGLFYVLKVIVHFCWYWWNCWPSLFKLSFHSKKMCTCLSNDQYEPFVDYIKTFLHLPTDFYAALLDFRMTKKTWQKATQITFMSSFVLNLKVVSEIKNILYLTLGWQSWI